MFMGTPGLIEKVMPQDGPMNRKILLASVQMECGSGIKLASIIKQAEFQQTKDTK
jgi:hypothetical protein